MESPVPSTTITLAFDDFGWKELQTEARAAGIGVEALIERAVDVFVRELSARDGNRLALEVPDASRGERSEEAARAEVVVTSEQLSALADEAERQEVAVPRLVEHAAFHYLARGNHDGHAG